MNLKTNKKGLVYNIDMKKNKINFKKENSKLKKEVSKLKEYKEETKEVFSKIQDLNRWTPTNFGSEYHPLYGRVQYPVTSGSLNYFINNINSTLNDIVNDMVKNHEDKKIEKFETNELTRELKVRLDKRNTSVEEALNKIVELLR